MRDSIVYKSVFASMSHFCRSVIFHSTQNFFFNENSMHSEQLTSFSLISRSWRFWIASIMRCLLLYVSSMWCSFACLESWLYLLCWSFFSIVSINLVSSSMLTTRVASSWRRDRTSMFLKSLRVRNALLKTNWSLFSWCEVVLIKHYATYVYFCATTCVSTWFSILIVVDVFHSCHCFIVILIFFWFWYVSTIQHRYDDDFSSCLEWHWQSISISVTNRRSDMIKSRSHWLLESCCRLLLTWQMFQLQTVEHIDTLLVLI